MRRIYHKELRREHPTGIIRTLPSLYGARSIGAKHYARSVQHLRAGGEEPIYIALSQQPTIEVLHLYIVIDGRVRIRLNIAGYLPGDMRQCWDKTYKTPKVWAVCTAPAVKPPEKLLMRGFQGIRYTEALW